MNLLVFTDLDGTLMEHESYSVEPAREALEALAKAGVSPIVNSSKTGSEIRAIQAKLELDAPYICENGAALSNYGKPSDKKADRIFGVERQSWFPAIQALRDQMEFKFEGFSDWSADELSARTGLSVLDAKLAKQRQYSEPIVWRDTSKAFSQFAAALKALNLNLIEGGRFFSIQGSHDKATGMKWLQGLDTSSTKLTVALGDSPNDIAMLEAADIAVVIKSPKSDQINLKNPKRVIRTNRPGPAGWQDAILKILREIDLDTVETNRGKQDG